MTDPSYLRRLEQRLTIVRLAGLSVLVAAIGFVDFPRGGLDDYSQILTTAKFVVAPVLFGGTVTIFFLSRRDLSERWRRSLTHAAFAFDMAIVLACVSLFGILPPFWNEGAGMLLIGWNVVLGPASILTLLIPIEGGLRYRMRGALLGAAIGAIFLAACLSWGLRMGALGTNLSFYVLLVSLMVVVAWVIGSAAEMWHRTNEAMRQQANRLVELDRLRDRYVAITSHEIRGPLTAIITGIDTVRTRGDRMDEETRTRLLDMVAQQGNQLARLVDDLMIGSEIEAGELAIRSELVDLETTVQRGVEGASPKRRAHQLELFIEPVRCEIDPYRISQMLRNLIENAYKYTPDRTRVVVSGKALDEGIELEVADDGPGIPLEKRDKLFEAFSRMRETAAGKEGVGLGLYVVSQLAIAMNGRIDLASSSRGTSFTIRIPCRTEPIEHRRMGLISNEEA